MTDMADAVREAEGILAGDDGEPSTVDSRALLIIPGLFAVALGLCFIFVGLDLLSNGGLTGLFGERR